MEFKKIENIKEYVNTLNAPVIIAAKLGTVKARKAKQGEKVITYSNGYETTNTAIEGQWILTKMLNGAIYHDGNGNINEWIISDQSFRKKYHLESNDIYAPKYQKSRFVQIHENISFLAPWKELMNIKEDGYLNITNIDDIYGIQKSDFLETYSVLSDGIIDYTQNKVYAMLFDYPLYSYVRNDSISILIYGFSNTTNEVLNTILQMGQMPGVRLCVNVLTDDAETAKELYLDDKPHLKEFFSINDSQISSYGEIHFINGMELKDEMVDKNDYIFIDSMDKNINKSMAEKASQQKPSAFIAYLGEERIHVWNKVKFEHYEYLPILEKLEQFAFNTHLSWEDSINGDFELSYKQFIDEKNNGYNHKTSLAYALSIKYKLHFFGIELTDDLLGAAKQFSNEIKTSKKVNMLAALEHRRWVVSLLTEGWGPLPEDPERFSYVLDKSNHKNSSLKQHPCLVLSQEAAPLKENKGIWDKGDYSVLDPLDSFSVEIHRFFMQEALKLKTTKYAQSNEYKLLPLLNNTRLMNDPETRALIGKLDYNTRSIIDGAAQAATQHKKIASDAVLRIKEKYPEIVEVEKCVSELYKDIYPAIEATRYTDFKAYDEILIRKIPFILTYKPKAVLAQGFDISNSQNGINDIIFNNVAAALVIKPARIVYFVEVTNKTKEGLLSRTIKSCKNFLNSYCKAKIYIIAVVHNLESQAMSNLKDLRKKGVIDSLEYIEATSFKNTLEFFMNKYCEYNVDYFNGTNSVFSSTLYNAYFVNRMYSLKHFFEFDFANKKFITSEGCHELGYIQDKSFLRVSDMFALMAQGHVSYNYPDYSLDIERLWKIYTGHHPKCRGSQTEMTTLWNAFCDGMSFYVDGLDSNKRRCQCISDTHKVNISILERYCMRPVSHDELLNLLEALSEENIVTPERNVNDIIVSFTAEDKIMKVLSKAGELLEIKAFFDCLNSGYFDDVSASFEFDYDGTRVKNEIDLVVTKGFKSIIVECKATSKLDQNYYHKLNTIADLFGVAVRKVILINDYQVRNVRDNQMQIERGNLMDTITITNACQIDIAKKLKNIIENE